MLYIMVSPHRISTKSCDFKKEAVTVQNIPEEYLTLFNTLTDAEKSLLELRDTLISAQQRAEELYLEHAEALETPPAC